MPSLLSRIATVSTICLAGAALPASAYAATSTATTAATSVDSASIADKALAQVGTYGGQCKQFVNDILARASHGSVTLGGGYYSDYKREGGHRVSAKDAVKGDIIQLNVPGAPDSFGSGMHTAIIVANLGHHKFQVVDSNWVGHETVGTHVFNPYTRAASRGLKVNIWHF